MGLGISRAGGPRRQRASSASDATAARRTPAAASGSPTVVPRGGARVALAGCVNRRGRSSSLSTPVKDRGWSLLLVIVILAALRPSAAARVELHVDLEERVNAVYHLACLAGTIGCTTDAFERFWKERLGWTDADQAALDLWRGTMLAVTNAAPARPPAPLLPNTARFHPPQVARTAVIVAAIETASIDGLRRRSGGILDREAATGVKRAVDHFERRVRSWFRATGRRLVERRVGQIRDAARRRRFADATARTAMFLETELPDPDVYLHVIAGPDPESTDSAATVFGNHFVVEVVDTTTADGIVEGAAHELTHYLYDRVPVDTHLALIDTFVTSAAQSAAGLYTYMNEAVAIASQALLEDPSDGTSDDDASYQHPYIAPLGAATVPLVRDAVARKTTLAEGFASSYIAAGTVALKEKLVQPQFVLAQVGLLLPDDSDAIRAAYFQKMFPQASAQFRHERELDAFPDLNVIRFQRYDALGPPGDGIPGLAGLREHRGFAYAWPRGRGARTYLLAGRDTEAIIDAIETLAGLKALPSDGVLFSLD